MRNRCALRETPRLPHGGTQLETPCTMPRRSRTTPSPASSPSSSVPPRRRGGQELPDEVQDRPEQNAGYDEAVHGSHDEAVLRRSIFADVTPEDLGAEDEVIPPAPGSN